MGHSIRRIPNAALGLSFTAGCALGGDEPIVGTWDAVQFIFDGEDVSAEYLYSEVGRDGCLYTNSLVMVIGEDLVGGLFSGYSRVCPDPADSYSEKYGSYVTAAHTEGRWLISFNSYAGLDCTLGAQLGCDIRSDYDYDYEQRIVFERR